MINHRVTLYGLKYMKKNIWQKIEEKKKMFDSKKPFSPEFIRKMDKWMKIEQTYTSNAIEGNSLTREETARIVNSGEKLGKILKRKYAESKGRNDDKRN